jgi:hypothetical protein
MEQEKHQVEQLPFPVVFDSRQSRAWGREETVPTPRATRPPPPTPDRSWTQPRRRTSRDYYSLRWTRPPTCAWRTRRPGSSCARATTADGTTTARPCPCARVRRAGWAVSAGTWARPWTKGRYKKIARVKSEQMKRRKVNKWNVKKCTNDTYKKRQNKEYTQLIKVKHDPPYITRLQIWILDSLLVILSGFARTNFWFVTGNHQK